MRAIDADAFLQSERNRCGGEPIIGTCNQDDKYLVDALKEQKEIGVENARRGKWILDEDGDGVHCSECEYDCYAVIYATEYFKYCPNCGAKMR